MEEFGGLGGGTLLRADDAVRAEEDDADPDFDHRAYSRLVIQIEFGNHNASQLPEVGYAALDNDYTTLFLGMKVWKRTKAGYFGAAAVL